jgi:hypothetical protein
MAATVGDLSDVEELHGDVRGSILMRGGGEYGPFVHADPSPVHMAGSGDRPRCMMREWIPFPEFTLTMMGHLKLKIDYNGPKLTAAGSMAHFPGLLCLEDIRYASLGNQSPTRHSGTTVPVKSNMQAVQALKKRSANRIPPLLRNGPI